jgi:hypothetical protein
MTTDANGTTTPETKKKATTRSLAKAPPSPDHGGAIDVFASAANFEQGQRMARALAESTLVPAEYRSNLSNVLIAIELASRVGASVFAVMQNIDIIHGRPSWRATFLIATVNACGRFTPMRFRFEGQPGTDGYGCRAVAKDRETGEECPGALITIGLARAEGWAAKNGSKWKTMPEQMLMYRAAAFWTRVFAPELSLGMQTSDEAIDTTTAVTEAVRGSTTQELPALGGSRSLEAALLAEPETQTPPHDPVTGEVKEEPAAREPGEEG